MTDKQIIKQLAERYKEICRSPFADGYTFTAFDGECAKKGFTRDDIKNYIEKEKQERKAKRTESIKSLKEQLKRKKQECEVLALDARVADNHLQQRIKMCDLLGEKLKDKEQECEELKEQIKKHNDDMFKNPPEKRFYCKGCTLPYISKKLKQTLTEIKEIITNFYETGFLRTDDDCILINNHLCVETLDKILQKISEALE